MFKLNYIIECNTKTAEQILPGESEQDNTKKRLHLLEHLSGVLVPESGLINAGYFCDKFGFESFHPNFCKVRRESVAECKEHGVETNVWTVNFTGQLEQCYGWGCDGVFTDYP